MAFSEDASSSDLIPRPSAIKAESESAGSPKAWFITWEGNACQELPQASSVGARAPEQSKLFETPSGANAEAVGTRWVPATPSAGVDRGLSPLCSDSELSLLVSEDESVPGTPRKLSSLAATPRKDALINELRERCAALESEGSVLRQRLERMEDGDHNTQLTSELHEMSKSVANLHQRQNVEVLKLRTELAAAQAMLRGRRQSETWMEASLLPPPPPLPDQLSSPHSLQPQVSCPSGHSMHPQTPRPGGPQWICDGCEAQHEATSPVKRYRCFECNYDLCTFCHEGKLEERCEQPEGVPLVGLGHEAQGGARCRQGHVLHPASALDTGSKWMCDGCTRACDELGGSSRFRCAQCDFDLCLDCYAIDENCKKDERDAEGSGPAAESKQTAVVSATRSFTPEQLAFQRGREIWNNSVPRQRNGHSLEADPWRKHECVAAAYAFRSMGQKRAASVEGEGMRSSRPSTPSFGSPCTDVPSSGSSLTSTSAQSSPSRPGSDVLALSAGRPPAPVITPPPPLHRHRVHVPPISAAHPGGAGLDGSTGSTASSHQSTAGKQSEQPRLSVRTAMPATKEAFIHLHNEVAMPFMRRTADLGKAFQYLGEANALHIRLCGKASGEALYNMACCLSLGAAAVAAVHAGAVPGSAEDPAPGLPPARGEYATSQEHAEARLDRAIKLLEAAVELGYNNVANMTLDPDIAALRDRRPQTFAAILSRAHSVLAGPASTSFACRMPQMVPPVMWAKA